MTFRSTNLEMVGGAVDCTYKHASLGGASQHAALGAHAHSRVCEWHGIRNLRYTMSTVFVLAVERH